jgi:hypothetical protein
MSIATALDITLTTATVKALDNSGADCQYCSTEGAVVDTQLYYTIDGERVMEDGCGGCMFGRIFEVNALGVDTFHTETEEK